MRGSPGSIGTGSVTALLESTLALAVPLWIDELSRRPWSYVEERARECAIIVAGKGDLILFTGKTSGETAAAFNRLAEGVACCAFSPGGVTVMGMHFEAKHEGTK